MERCKRCQKALKEFPQSEFTTRSNSSADSFVYNSPSCNQKRVFGARQVLEEHHVTITQCGHLFHTYCIKKLLDKANHKKILKCPVCSENVRKSDGTHPIKLHQGPGKLDKVANKSKLAELDKKIDKSKKELHDFRNKKNLIRIEISVKEKDLNSLNSSGILEKVNELRESRTVLEEKIRTLTSRNAQLIDYFEKQKLDKHNILNSIKGKIELETKKSAAITTLLYGETSILNLTNLKEKSQALINIINNRQGKLNLDKKSETGRKSLVGKQINFAQWENKNVVTLYKKEKELAMEVKPKKVIQVNSSTRDLKYPSKSRIPVLKRNCRTDISKSSNSSCTSFELFG